MFRNTSSMMGSSHSFVGSPASTTVASSGNGAFMGGFGLTQTPTGAAATPGTTVVPGQGIAGMMNGFAGTNGLDIGSIMSGFGLTQTPTGAAATPGTTAVPGQGTFAGMMNGLTGTTGLNIGSIMSNIGQHLPLNGTADASTSSVVPGFGIGGMMNGLIQDALNGNTDTSATAPSTVQTMFNIMDNAPGINLVGLGHMNFFDFGQA